MSVTFYPYVVAPCYNVELSISCYFLFIMEHTMSLLLLFHVIFVMNEWFMKQENVLSFFCCSEIWMWQAVCIW